MEYLWSMYGVSSEEEQKESGLSCKEESPLGEFMLLFLGNSEFAGLELEFIVRHPFAMPSLWLRSIASDLERI